MYQLSEEERAHANASLKRYSDAQKAAEGLSFIDIFFKGAHSIEEADLCLYQLLTTQLRAGIPNISEALECIRVARKAMLVARAVLHRGGFLLFPEELKLINPLATSESEEQARRVLDDGLNHYLDVVTPGLGEVPHTRQEEAAYFVRELLEAMRELPEGEPAGHLAVKVLGAGMALAFFGELGGMRTSPISLALIQVPDPERLDSQEVLADVNRAMELAPLGPRSEEAARRGLIACCTSIGVSSKDAHNWFRVT